MLYSSCIKCQNLSNTILASLHSPLLWQDNAPVGAYVLAVNDIVRILFELVSNDGS